LLVICVSKEWGDICMTVPCLKSEGDTYPVLPCGYSIALRVVYGSEFDGRPP